VKLCGLLVGLLALVMSSWVLGQTSAPAASPTLTVKDGSFKDTKNKDVLGSAAVAAGARIWITADDAPPDKAFDKWVGDTQGLSKSGLIEAHTILTMPAVDVTLAATYKDFKSVRVACIGDTPTDMTTTPGNWASC
jgi:hypothetical protein